MGKLWAQKERNNLMRIIGAGLPCPRPLKLKYHVLLLTFIGSSNGRPAPKLKEVRLSDPRLKACYMELIMMMRTLWCEAKLVHADLSEFNLLYHEHRIYMIDVAQAIERSHPNALHHLQKDCENVTNFFAKRGLKKYLSVPELIEFVTDAKEMFIGVQEVMTGLDDDANNSLGLHELIEKLGNQHVREIE